MLNKNNYKIFDTHAHFNIEPLLSNTSLIEECKKNNILVNCVGVDYETSLLAVQQANKYENIYASVGIHPEEIKEGDFEKIEELLKNNNKIIAIGEVGLDYYHMNFSPEIQKECFIKFINLAIKYSLPLICHIRNAHEDAYEILKEYRNKLGNVLIHCFDEKKEWAIKYNELNCYMAIGGKITYDNAASYLPEATKNIDINHLVVETDAPFLSPIPFRKQTNTPLLMEYTIKKISEVLNMDLENLEKILFNNSIKLFNI